MDEYKVMTEGTRLVNGCTETPPKPLAQIWTGPREQKMRNRPETLACKPRSRSPFALDDQGLTLPRPSSLPLPRPSSRPLQCALAGVDQSQSQSYFPKISFSNKATIAYQHLSENQRYIFQIRKVAGKSNPSFCPLLFDFSLWGEGGNKIIGKYKSVPNI